MMISLGPLFLEAKLISGNNQNQVIFAIDVITYGDDSGPGYFAQIQRIWLFYLKEMSEL